MAKTITQIKEELAFGGCQLGRFTEKRFVQIYCDIAENCANSKSSSAPESAFEKFRTILERSYFIDHVLNKFSEGYSRRMAMLRLERAIDVQLILDNASKSKGSKNG
jgi:hypothetical protein